MNLVQEQFAIKSRARGAVGTTANTDTLVYGPVPTGSPPVKIEDILLNCAGGTTRTVDVGLVASGETYADGTYDIATALSVAAGTPVKGANTFCPFYMFAGDSLHILAAGAGIRYQVNIASERATNGNVGGI